jgi:hypothetical protein
MGRSRSIVFALSVLAVLGCAATTAAKPPTCDATAVADAKLAVDAACPCAGKPDGQGGTLPWKNHGQYVSCVTRATQAEANGAGIARQCLRDVVPCAAHSSCGKSTDVDVACSTLTLGTCTAQGTCDNDTTKACAADADCSVQSCAIMSSAECAAATGSEATVSCCSQ